MPRSDQQLIAEFRAGNDLAFMVLYNRYRPAVLAFCRQLLLDDPEAEDIAQDAFLRIYRRRGKLSENSNFRGLVFVAARNLCLNQLRNRKKRAHKHLTATEASGLEDQEDPVARFEDQEAIRAALAQIQPHEREMLLLREFGGFSYQEIADMLGTTVSTVKTRLFRTREKLRRILTPIYPTER